MAVRRRELEISPNHPVIDDRPLIELWLPDRQELKDLLLGSSEFRSLRLAEGALPPRSWLDQTRYLSGLSERGYRWSVPYLISLPREAKIVGSIGGKGIVAAETEVEIGYNVAPAFRGRGVATAAIGLIAAVAKQEGITLLAHTLPDNEASRRALRRAEFVFDDVILLPGDLRLERWSRSPD